MFNRNPAFEASRRVLSEMLGEGAIGAATSNVVTDALRRELVVHEVGAKAEELRRCERLEEFPRVTELYRVIDSDTRTVVVDPELVKRLNEGQRVSWRDLLRGSVQIWARKVETLGIRGVAGHEELYYWSGIYDADFLGYMAGVLPLIQGRDTGLFA
jgi:hypothetical protein